MVPDTRKTRSGAGTPRASSSAASRRIAKLSAQLPLQPGRRAAFCQPSESGDGEWILATVLSRANEDKHRYVVQDAEDESGHGPYVVLLTQDLDGDARHARASSGQPGYHADRGLRARDARPGPVSRYQLFLWCHCAGWRAADQRVRLARQGTCRLSHQLQKRETELLHAPYDLMFDDDGADVKQVPAYLVVEHPNP